MAKLRGSPATQRATLLCSHLAAAAVVFEAARRPALRRGADKQARLNKAACVLIRVQHDERARDTLMARRPRGLTGQ
ncbi:hypothetical protein BDZ90DRAFT_231148 [Jaminaea rosea]|uniref:Uncharacterized protein n=1 Tax=Jaminaea rosea TaxID=1569628 RepID=A0A316UV22_9BASI|nr:hypothetical protein BDZ90DRAFT_231148 [Jaminaea rosea]PWN29150.1 hypothetical protein BDZ90DRAFT_231148 [Jaminaea rosea]